MEGQTKEQLQEALSASDKQVTDLESKVARLEEQLAQTNKSLLDIANWLRFTLGIAYNAHPESEEIKAMVSALFKKGE